MKNGDNSEQNCESVLAEVEYCRRFHFRVGPDLRAGLKEIVQAFGYRCDGYSLNDLARAALARALDGLARQRPAEIVRELQPWLSTTKARRGRPKKAPKPE
jgi:hypothetical protein